MKLKIYDNFLSNSEVKMLKNDLNSPNIRQYLHNYKIDETGTSFEMPVNLTQNVKNFTINLEYTLCVLYNCNVVTVQTCIGQYLKPSSFTSNA